MSAIPLAEEDYQTLLDIMRGPHGEMPVSGSSADLLIVFCSADPAIARQAAALYAAGRFTHAVFAGNVGKDAGDLAQLGITEAAFQASIALAGGLPARSMHLEERSTNAAENAQFSLQLATELGLIQPDTRLASLAPGPRSRRLYEELRYQHAQLGLGGAVVGGFSTNARPVVDEAIQVELVREASGLMTMHSGSSPRIFPQPDFLDDGAYGGLISRLSTLLADSRR